MARRPFRDVMFRRWMPDGSLVYHLTSGDPVFDADGQFRGYRGIGKNITDQIRAQERIERLATVDALTQLSNRQNVFVQYIWFFVQTVCLSILYAFIIMNCRLVKK